MPAAAVNQATAIESMIPFVQQVADELTQKPTADEHGCDPCATGTRGARDPSPAIHPFVGRGVWTVATSASMRER